MIAGFNIDSELMCEGIIGDGCGGGRIFFVKNEILFAHDLQTKENIKLLQDIKNAQSISKKACLISIKCKDKIIEFDLSSLSKK
jgi:hypothetical protein